MRGRPRRMRTLGLLLGLVVAALPARALTLAELIDKHAAARGGKARWADVQSIELKGRYEAFSVDVPMTIARARPQRYRFDFELFEAPAAFGFDGTAPWVRSAMFEAPDGRAVDGGLGRNIRHDAAIGPRLLARIAEGADAELVGPKKVEGRDAWMVRVRPKGLSEEVWYIDAQTHLEILCVSRTYDIFSGPDAQAEVEMFFSDFRDVDGLTIPFREERHFSIRHHVYVIESIELNPKIEAKRFDASTP